MTRIYLCFDTDQDTVNFAADLADHLREMGLDVGSSSGKTPPDPASYDRMLLLLTSHTLASEQVREAVGGALDAAKPIVPLIVGSADVQIPDDLHGLTAYTPLRFDAQNPDATLNRLKRVLSPEYAPRTDDGRPQNRKTARDAAPSPLQRMIPMVVIAGGLFSCLILIAAVRAITPPATDSPFVIDPTSLIVPPTPTVPPSTNLQVQPDDLPAAVIGKAVILRQSGDIEAAIDAFEQYGVMFAPQDPTAPLYAQIAVQFSRLISGTNTQGGAYIASVDAGSVAEQNGFMVGDIITRFNGQPVSNQLDIRRFLSDTGTGTAVDITFLRRDSTGNFSEFTVPVTLFAEDFGALFYSV